MKLTIEQLKNYLGTGLRVEHPSTRGRFWKLSHDEGILNTISLASVLEIEAKLLCYRLSDLDKFIPELGFVPIEEFLRMTHKKWFDENQGSRYQQIETRVSPNFIEAYFKYMATLEVSIWVDDINHQKFWIAQKLFQWHFWPFGDEYFEAGLVIDKLKMTEK